MTKNIGPPAKLNRTFDDVIRRDSFNFDTRITTNNNPEDPSNTQSKYSMIDFKNDQYLLSKLCSHSELPNTRLCLLK